MKQVLVFDEERGTYVTLIEKKIYEIKRTVKDPTQEITINDVYELLLKVLDVLEELAK
jgi:hypothetical protein